MPISTRIREQIISTFRVEVAEHMQTISDGLLVLEKHQQSPEEHASTLQEIFRAAHSLKGAARAVGVIPVEQLGHGLENILSDLQKGAMKPSSELFTVCYHTLDAIQGVEEAYAAGETTPPIQVLQALAELEGLRAGPGAAKAGSTPTSTGGKPAAAAGISDAVQPTQENQKPFTIQTEGGGEPEIEPPVDARGSGGDVSAKAGDAPALAGEGALPALNETSAPTAQAANWTDETIRVRVEKLDSVINQLSELLMAKIRLDQRLVQINQLQAMMADWQKGWMSARDQQTQKRYRRRGAKAAGGEVEEPGPGNLFHSMLPSQDLIKEISNKINDLSRDTSNDTIHLKLAIDALDQEVKQIRLLPLSTITGAFGRMMRNLANSAGKGVNFEILGAEVEMDKRVLELVKDPLIHMLRNAVDHGIEPAADRSRAGKQAAGNVTLSAEHQGKDVVLRVADDGSGLDMNAIRRAVARQTGLDSQELSESELTGWIFSAGVSTSPIVTDVSGRGIGLDVVRRNVEALRGRIDVETTPGGGTAFTLTIPMALTSSHVLLVQAAGQIFALPLSSIERIIAVKAADAALVGGQRVLQSNGRPIPLVHLKTVLGLADGESRAEDGGPSQAVILGAAERRMAFVVDELLGEQDIVIKGLGKQLARVGGIAGATVLGSGKVALVLNAADLMKMALRSESRWAGAGHPASQPVKKKRRQQSILVVDDSITTRTLEKHILEAEGFIVKVATDGEEALSVIATSGMPDLIITDINMPRINGFELTSRLKADPRTSGVPVFLVSSLDSAEDKARGIQVGADAYIVKSRFDQGNLLELIQQMIG